MVLDVEQGGIEVPSFVGKTVRGAVEAAQDTGLELDAVGSGVARQQISRGRNARGRRSAGDGAVRAVSQNLNHRGHGGHRGNPRNSSVSSVSSVVKPSRFDPPKKRVIR